jgi:hypothetical protein
MPLNEKNTRTFHRTLYGGTGMLQTVTLLKRDDDQRQGNVTAYKLFQVRWSRIFKTGEPILGDMSSSHTRTVHLPRIELDRVGVAHINALDRFVDREGVTWQPESTTNITVKLFQNHICVVCLRVKG